MIRWRWKFIFLVIVLLGFFVRFFKLSSFPPALYVDEALVGYNAFALTHDLRDEYGEFLPIAFRAWGTYAAPLQYYLAIIGTKLFGLNEFGTRFHSAFMGGLTIPVAFFLARRITRSVLISLLAAFFLAFSPWHIHQSRMAVETTTSVFFLTLGVYLFLSWKDTGRIFLLWAAAFSFALTFYAYHTGRVTTPLLLLLLVIFSWRKLLQRWQSVIGAGIFGLIISLPLLFHVITDYETVTARPRAINVFADKGVTLRLWEDITSDGNAPAVIVRAFHNKGFGYAEDILQRYASHLEPAYLFISGDPHERFQIPNTGLLLLLGLVIVPVGLFALVRMQMLREYRLLILGWIFLVPIVSSFAFITPNSYHTLEAVVPWMIVLAIGVVALTQWGKRRFGRGWAILIGALVVMNLGHYFVQYYKTLPSTLAPVWAYGFKDAVASVKNLETSYDRIVFSNRVYILVLYYLQYPPEKFRAEYIRDPGRDQWGFEHIRKFGKYEFEKNFDWTTIEKDPGILYVVEDGLIPKYWPDEKTNRLRRMDEIFYPSGEKALELVKIN